MINVYYGCYLSDVEGHAPKGQYCEEPTPVIKTIVNSTGLDSYNKVFKCPAIADFTRNMYQVSATYDYDLLWDGTSVTSTLYNQTYFNSYVIPRELTAGLLSYGDPPLYMFADCDSLELTQLPVMFEKNPNSYITLPGTYNIANHFRKLELAMIFNKPGETLKITSGMPLYYIKFNTKEKINFIRFNFTKELWDISQILLKYRNFTKKIIPLEWYYSTVRRYYKKQILKIIKQNTLN